MNNLTQMPLKRHPAFYTVRNQFQIIFHILEVAVFGALRHCAETAHPTIRLILSGFIDDRFTRTFIYPRKHGSHHDGIGTSCNGFRYVARSEEHTSELQSRGHRVCRLLLEKKKNRTIQLTTHLRMTM